LIGSINFLIVPTKINVYLYSLFYRLYLLESLIIKFEIFNIIIL
jgi:hypothetical protein